MKEKIGKVSFEHFKKIFQFSFKNYKNTDIDHKSNIMRDLVRSHIPLMRLCDFNLKSSQKFFMFENSSSDVFGLMNSIASNDFIGFIQILTKKNLKDLAVSVIVELIWSTFIYSDLNNLPQHGALYEIIKLIALTKIVQSIYKFIPSFLGFKLHLERKVYMIDVKSVCDLYETLKHQFVPFNLCQKNFYSNLYSPAFAKILIEFLDKELKGSPSSNKIVLLRETRSVILIMFERNKMLSHMLKSEISEETEKIANLQENLLISILSLVPQFEITNPHSKDLFQDLQKILTYYKQLKIVKSGSAYSEKDSLTVAFMLLFLEVLPRYFSLTMREDKLNSKSKILEAKKTTIDIFVSLIWKICSDSIEFQKDLEIQNKLETIIKNKELIGLMGFLIQQFVMKKIHNYDDLLYLLERNLMKDLLLRKPIIRKVAKQVDNENLHQLYVSQLIPIIKDAEKINGFFSSNGMNQVFLKAIRVGFNGKLQEKVRNVVELLGLIQTSEAVNFNLFNYNESECDIMNSGHNFLKKTEKFKDELSRRHKLDSKKQPSFNFEHHRFSSDFLSEQKVATVYDIYVSLMKLKIKIHPRDILFFMIHSKFNVDFKADSSLNMIEVINILKKSIYCIIKEDLRLFDFTPFAFSLLNYTFISFTQKIYAVINNHFLSVDIVFLFLMIITNILSYFLLKMVVFKWRRTDYREIIKTRLKKIIIA